MRRAAIGVFLSSLGAAAGFRSAAADSLTEVRIQRVVPGTITSEASLEYCIALAARLIKGDTAKDLAAMTARLDALKRQKQSLTQQMAAQAQLAAVDLEIKVLMQEIDGKRREEQDEKDDIAHAEEALQRLNEALDKAAGSYTAIVGATSMNTFVRSLSAEKKRDTKNKSLLALAQLAEARRIRLQLSASSPAFQPAPKPLTTK